MTSCFDSGDEQIYLADVLIEKLELPLSKIKEIGGQPIVIKVIMLGLKFEIMHERVEMPEVKRQNAEHFRNGGCFLFIMKPQKLIDDFNTEKLKIGVYRDKDHFPTAEADLLLMRCPCDQTVIGSDPEKLPSPIVKKNKFQLLDSGKNPSGHVSMELRIECIGRTVAMRYELYDRCSKIDLNKIWELCLKRFVPFEFLGERFIKYPTAPEEQIATTETTAAKLPKKEKKGKYVKGKTRKKGRK